MMPCVCGGSTSTMRALAEGLARMLSASFLATLTTTRQPGPDVAITGGTMASVRNAVSAILNMACPLAVSGSDADLRAGPVTDDSGLDRQRQGDGRTASRSAAALPRRP